MSWPGSFSFYLLTVCAMNIWRILGHVAVLVLGELLKKKRT